MGVLLVGPNLYDDFVSENTTGPIFQAKENNSVDIFLDEGVEDTGKAYSPWED